MFFIGQDPEILPFSIGIIWSIISLKMPDIPAIRKKG